MPETNSGYTKNIYPSGGEWLRSRRKKGAEDLRRKKKDYQPIRHLPVVKQLSSCFLLFPGFLWLSSISFLVFQAYFGNIYWMVWWPPNHPSSQRHHLHQTDLGRIISSFCQDTRCGSNWLDPRRLAAFQDYQAWPMVYVELYFIWPSYQNMFSLFGWNQQKSWPSPKSAHTALAVKACLLGCNTATLNAQVTFVNIAVAISALAGGGGPLKKFRTEPFLSWCFRIFWPIFGCCGQRGYWNGILGRFGGSWNGILGRFGGYWGGIWSPPNPSWAGVFVLLDNFWVLRSKRVLRWKIGSLWRVLRYIEM